MAPHIRKFPIFYSKALICLLILILSFSGCLALLPLVESDYREGSDARPGNYSATPKVASYANPSNPTELMWYKGRDRELLSQSTGGSRRAVPQQSLQALTIARLVRQLSAETAVARTHAASDLGVFGPAGRAAIGPLAYALANDESKWVRRAAAKALGKIGDEEVVEPLRKALRDKNHWVAHSARNALSRVERNLERERRLARNRFLR